jgi:sugar lactone lactonase YvrE
MSQIYDHRRCELGEGAFWHPERQTFLWFDILGSRLMGRTGDDAVSWKFPLFVSAAAWVADDVILVAGERSLMLYALDEHSVMPLVELEADKADNRSNDGRADRQGGFWIGTMGKDPKDRKGKGAIYRLYKGEVRTLYSGISIPNAICFSPDGSVGYFADTAEQTVWKVALDADGWPAGEREIYLDFKGTDIYPDGATVDAEGNFWNAQWGSSRVAAYSPAGDYLREVKFDAPHTSCPAFGGPELTTLFCTTALEEMSEEARAAHPNAGKVFFEENVAKGLPEPRFLA